MIQYLAGVYAYNLKKRIVGFQFSKCERLSIESNFLAQFDI